MSRVSPWILVAVLLATSPAGADDRPDTATKSVAMMRAELTLRNLIREGRWGPIAGLVSAHVATDPYAPRALSGDDLMLACAHIDNRLGLTPYCPGSWKATFSSRVRETLASLPEELGWPAMLARQVAPQVPIVLPEVLAKAAFERLPVASHRADATALTHLEMLKTPATLNRLLAMLVDLYRRAETDQRAANLIRAATGSGSALDLDATSLARALSRLDDEDMLSLKDARTERDRLNCWTYKLASIQASRVREMARRLIPDDRPGDPRVKLGFTPDQMILLTSALVFIGMEALGDPPSGHADSSDTARSMADAARDAREQARKRQDEIMDAKFATGLVTGILSRVQDPEVQRVGLLLENTANTIFQVAWASTLSSGLVPVVMPLALLNGHKKMLSLGGPSETQLLSEQIAELHREVIAFRREMQINIFYLHSEMHAKTDAILEHVDRLAELVERGFADQERRLDTLERRQIELRNLIENYHQQTLKRFADEYNTSYLKVHADLLKRRNELRGLDQGASEFKLKEIDDLGTHFFHFGFMVAPVASMAGGDLRVGGQHSPNEYPILDHPRLRQLVPFLDTPRGTMAYINDWAGLFDRDINRPSLVNPDAWRLATIDYFHLTELAPKAMMRDKSAPEVKRELASLYLAGEIERGFRAGLIRDLDRSVANRSVLSDVLLKLHEAIDDIEKLLLSPDYASKSAYTLDVDLWSEEPLQPRSGVVRCSAPEISQELSNRANGTPFGLPELKLPQFLLSDGEQNRLEATLPDAHRLAVQLKKGKVEFRFEDLRWSGVDRRTHKEWVRPNRDSHQAPYQVDVPEWFGKVRLTLAAYLLTGDREERRYPIYRRDVTAPMETRIGGEQHVKFNESNWRHRELSWDKPGADGEGRRVWKGKGEEGVWPFGREVDYAVVVNEPVGLRAAELEKHWMSLKEQFLAPGAQDLNPEDTKKLSDFFVDELIIRQLMNIESLAARDASGGLKDLGDTFRGLYAAQLLLFRFLELAAPGLLNEPGLAERVFGNEAVLSWRELGELMRPSVQKLPQGGYRLRISGLIQPGPGGKPCVPIASAMRARLDRVRTTLNEAITRLAADLDPPPYPELDDVLSEFPARARWLGFDLKAEVEKLANEQHVQVRSHWWIYREARDRARLLGICPELKPFMTTITTDAVSAAQPTMEVR
jgi:hypothetical protein